MQLHSNAINIKKVRMRLKIRFTKVSYFCGFVGYRISFGKILFSHSKTNIIKHIFHSKLQRELQIL